MLKFAVAPYRAGRSLDGAVDELVELMKQKADQPKGDDPTTATNKTAIQIEQIKQQRAAEADKQTAQLKVAELQQKDEHEKLKIASQEKIKMAELMSKQGDAQQKAQVVNLKSMHDREKHQADMIGKDFDMRAQAQKAAMAQQAAKARSADQAARSQERQAAAAAKQPPLGFGP